MSTTISFGEDAPDSATTTMVIGKKKVLEELGLSEKLGLGLGKESTEAMLDAINGDSGSSSTFCKKQKIVIGCIPEKVTRNNHPWSVHSITDMVASNLPKGQTSRLIFVGNDAVEYQGALSAAVAKAFPVYSHKTTSTSRKEGMDEENDKKNTRSIQIAFWDDKGNPVATKPDATKTALAAVEGVQLAARLVDMTPEELTTDAYSAECRQLADALEGVTMTEIVGEELNQKGYGGIYGVGKAATCPPRLVILEYNPPSGTEQGAQPICLVGKSIVYDTGGLSLKPKTGMGGMKADMGGSAGLLGGFVSAVKAGYDKRLVLLMCMAENAIGPEAFRNDDILTMYSGKTVEVNNCDAEGRLVLGDGVAHATKHLNPSLVIDMATLTGAQMVATGKKHASILTNKAELESQAVAAGLKSGKCGLSDCGVSIEVVRMTRHLIPVVSLCSPRRSGVSYPLCTRTAKE